MSNPVPDQPGVMPSADQTPQASQSPETVGETRPESPARQSPELASELATQPQPTQFEKQKTIQTSEQPESAKESPAVRLQKQVRMILEIGIGMSLLVVLINGFLLFFTQQQVKQYQINRQQIAAAQENSADLSYTVTFLENQKFQTDLIKRVLPDDPNFITFVQTIELISQDSGVRSQLDIGSLQTTDQGANYIPFEIEMTADIVSLADFLKRLEKIAYLVELNTLEAVVSSADQWQITIQANVYVSYNF